jgi:hypothetical protein
MQKGIIKRYVLNYNIDGASIDLIFLDNNYTNIKFGIKILLEAVDYDLAKLLGKNVTYEKDSIGTLTHFIIVETGV